MSADNSPVDSNLIKSFRVLSLSKTLCFFNLPGGTYITNPSLRQTNRETIELRNLVYEAFLELEPSPTEAANLVASHKQIFAEFVLMYLRTGENHVDLEDLDGFVNTFFLNYLNAALRQAPFDTKVKRPQNNDDLGLSVDLLAVVLILRQHLLLKIHWNESLKVSYGRFKYNIESCVTDLINSGDQLYQLASAKLEVVDYCCARHKHSRISGKTMGLRLLLRTESTVSSQKDKRKRFKKTCKLFQDLEIPVPEWYDYTCQEMSQDLKVRIATETEWGRNHCSKFW
jgi:hypothetical protein